MRMCVCRCVCVFCLGLSLSASSHLSLTWTRLGFPAACRAMWRTHAGAVCSAELQTGACHGMKPARFSCLLLPPSLTHSHFHAPHLSFPPYNAVHFLSSLPPPPSPGSALKQPRTQSQGTDCTLQRSHGLGCASVTWAQYCSSSASLVSSNQPHCHRRLAIQAADKLSQATNK